MFTGIVEKTSKVSSVVTQDGGLMVGIKTPAGFKLKRGDSININGVCSTVTGIGKVTEFFYIPETLNRTYFFGLKPGDMVNMERSLKLSDRLDGHMVLGHVDTVGKIKSIETAGQSKIMEIFLKRDTILLAPKGSVSLEGISLTTVDVSKNSFTVHLIPYTLEYTNLGQKKIGSLVNVEFDVFAKYVAGILKK